MRALHAKLHRNAKLRLRTLSLGLMRFEVFLDSHRDRHDHLERKDEFLAHRTFVQTLYALQP